MTEPEYAQLTRLGQIRRLRRVAERALPAYGIEPVSLSLLAHAFNTTFTVAGPDGQRYVLHIDRSMEVGLSESQRRARVESELWWLDRVRTDLDLAVPVTKRTPDGAGVVSVVEGGSAPAWICSLFHWMDGRLLYERLTPAHLEAVGSLTARLHRHSLNLRVPTWFDRPTVDPTDAGVEGDAVHLFTDHVSVAAAEVIRNVLERVRQAQRRLGNEPDTFGIIHADIHQKNYLFRGHQVRLIDFGDCGWGHYLYDLAVTVHQLGDLPRIAELRAALLAGYRRVHELSPAHEALIDTFAMLREVQDLTWLVEERDNPSHARWTAQIPNKVAMLQRLLSE